MKHFTTKQQRFIDCYCGNATEAARVAGYKHAVASAKDLMADPEILKAIDQREQKVLDDAIATREERQQYWTAVMRDESQDMKNRLRAAELLGRSEGDFVDRMKLESGLGEQLKAMSDDEIRERIRMLEADGVLMQ